MPASQYLKVESKDGVARLWLDRPKHNVLNLDMMKAVCDRLDTFAADRSLQCLVLLGQGPSWCAGVEVGDHKPERAAEMIAVFSAMLQKVENFDVPTIAGIQGACLGGGMELAIACDILIAGRRAVFGQPEIKLGFLPPYAAVRLPRLVGPAKAVEICTTGKRYTAEEALRLGFVSRVVEDDQLIEAVDQTVKEIAACSPLIIRLNKQAVNQHLELDATAAFNSVNELFLGTLMKTEDTLEGIRSFEEKRAPQWKNR
ncbi:MAG TPA: enoyl-CoA hydratase/isomerase family protein [Desulfobacterales bacterium]